MALASVSDATAPPKVRQGDDLERMYRGNTPYPIGKIRQATRTYPTQAMATRALGLMTSRRKALGYRAA